MLLPKLRMFGIFCPFLFLCPRVAQCLVRKGAVFVCFAADISGISNAEHCLWLFEPWERGFEHYLWRACIYFFPFLRFCWTVSVNALWRVDPISKKKNVRMSVCTPESSRGIEIYLRSFDTRLWQLSASITPLNIMPDSYKISFFPKLV